MDSGTQRSFNDIQLKHISRIFGRMVVLRAYAGGVLMVVVAGLAALDGAPWRWAWLATQVVCALTFFAYELRRYRREGVTARSVPINLMLGVLFQQSLVTGTGG